MNAKTSRGSIKNLLDAPESEKNSLKTIISKNNGKLIVAVHPYDASNQLATLYNLPRQKEELSEKFMKQLRANSTFTPETIESDKKIIDSLMEAFALTTRKTGSLQIKGRLKKSGIRSHLDYLGKVHRFLKKSEELGKPVLFLEAKPYLPYLLKRIETRYPNLTAYYLETHPSDPLTKITKAAQNAPLNTKEHAPKMREEEFNSFAKLLGDLGAQTPLLFGQQLIHQQKTKARAPSGCVGHLFEQLKERKKILKGDPKLLYNLCTPHTYPFALSQKLKLQKQIQL